MFHLLLGELLTGAPLLFSTQILILLSSQCTIQVRMRPRLLDYIIFLGTLFIIGIFSFNAYGKTFTPEVTVITSPHGTWVYPLNTDTIVSVDGALGITKIEISNGKVRVLSSPCREKICIQTGSISKTGTWIACVPNRVFLKIEGKGDDETDTDSF